MDRRSFLLNAAALPVGAPAAAALPIALPVALPLPVPLPVPGSDNMHFRVLRNGSPIGDHAMQFTPSGNGLSISIVADLKVAFAGITMFRYSVKAAEYWENGIFQHLDSAVNFNGTPLEVHALRTPAGYDVQGTNVARYAAPANLLPLTYWNKAMIGGTILNIQTAHCYPVRVNSPGWNALPTATGGVINAQRFDLTGKLRLSVWYDQNSNWAGLAFQKSGDISYEKYT